MMAVEKEDLQVHLDDKYHPIRFEGFVKSVRTNENTGEMIISLAVTAEWKFYAVLTTDYPGTMFDIEFQRQREDDPDEDGAE